MKGTGFVCRVFITGGGCNGFSYGFTFDDTPAEDDAVIERLGVHACGCNELPLLSGSDIDYVEDLAGAQFTVSNPNASATCGCGSSFSL